jgi:hypothetical protein
MQFKLFVICLTIKYQKLIWKCSRSFEHNKCLMLYTLCFMHACYVVSKLLIIVFIFACYTTGNHSSQSFTGCHEAYVCWHLGMQEV